MIFPELRERLKSVLPDSGSPISLNLKSDYNPVSASELEFYRGNGYHQIYQMLSGGMPSWAGESVNLNSALGHSVFWACYALISETIGMIPATVMQESSSGKFEAQQHPMYRAMKMVPNPELTAQEFIETMTGHCLVGGNGYAQIIRRSGTGTAIELILINPACVFHDREKSGAKRFVYVIRESGVPDKTFTIQSGKPQDIFHLRGLGWDGISGFSRLTLGKQSIGTALAAEKNIGNFWRMGGRLPYILKMAGKFKSDEEFKRFRADWELVYGDPHKAPMLENGIEYEQTGTSMADSQALESRQWTVSELCRWFNVSPHLVQDLSRATFSNIEHLFIQFKVITLAPWMKRWSQSFFRCVLTPEEQEKGYFLKLNADAMLRGDFQTRMQGIATALQNGHMSIDEVRDLEDRNPLPNGIGSHYHIQTNMGTIVRDGQIQPAQPITQLDSESATA